MDLVIFKVNCKGTSRPELLLIERGNEPYKGFWALPGGYVDKEDDDLLSAAARELREETGLVNLSLKQIGAWGSSIRDPRDWTVTVVYGAVLSPDNPALQHIRAADDARQVRWFSVDTLPKLAFDHSEVITEALSFLQ